MNVAHTVLRGESGGNSSDLLDYEIHKPELINKMFGSMFNFKYFFLLLIIIGMGACRSHKKASSSFKGELQEEDFYTSCYPIESLWIPSCKLDLTLDNQSYSLNGSIYIRSDSVCYFRGKMLMIEVRGAIYRDSFLVVNYWERVCYKGRNEYLQRIAGYPVNPESLMMLFTDDKCEGAFRNSRQRQDIFNVAYSDYVQYPQFTLPTVVDISAIHDNTPIRIKANFQQILFNQPQEVNISVPSRYKVLEL